MFAETHRRAVLTALVLSTLTAACAGDEVLGAPDARQCTAGTLTVGVIKSGSISADDCLMWEDYNYGLFLGESWTINTKANTVYIVRFVPVADDSGANTLFGEVALYARNGAGDATFATGRWSVYGTQNENGGTSEELVFASPKASTVSLRVWAWGAAYVGSYQLEVTACPAERLDMDGEAVEQLFDDEGCGLIGFGARFPAPTPVRFWMFDADSGVSFTTTFTRVSGSSDIRGRLRGPGFDVGCYSSTCFASSTTSGSGPFSLVRTPVVSGTFTLAMFQQTVGTLTGSARVVRTPVAAAATHAQR